MARVVWIISKRSFLSGIKGLLSGRGDHSASPAAGQTPLPVDRAQFYNAYG
jgi:hypothetical protein